MKRLLRAIWHLGPRLGYRYWKIERECRDNPELLWGWINTCRAQARLFHYDNDGFTPRGLALIKWANQLEAIAERKDQDEQS